MLTGVAATAQIPSLDPEGRLPAYFDFVQPGRASVEVNVWGDVKAPGRYRVDLETDIMTLLSLAGGPGDLGERVNQIATTTVILSRRQGAGWQDIMEMPLGDLSTLQTELPALRSDDVLRIKTSVRSRVQWTQVLRLAGSIASIILALDRLNRNL